MAMNMMKIAGGREVLTVAAMRSVCCVAMLAAVQALVPTPLVSRQAAVSGRRGDIQMAGAAALERKTKVLNEVRSKMDGASLMFCVRSEGIRVNEINALRQTLPDGVEFKCVKNTLVNLAAKEYENFNADNIDTLLHYSNYWFFVQEEKMRESVELWNDWIKKGKKASARS
eukprot:5866995-Pleurochrysis_carterae.AAC.3